uniref:Uncharacterized protein n=1 Tax=Anguilla anguilla TaxID=7936 RepID=A0A0E9XH82_ANGAN
MLWCEARMTAVIENPGICSCNKHDLRLQVIGVYCLHNLKNFYHTFPDLRFCISPPFRLIASFFDTASCTICHCLLNLLCTFFNPQWMDISYIGNINHLFFKSDFLDALIM